MSYFLRNKKIIFGITGSIAAYKAPELVRLLRQEGATVRVILTRGAEDFVTPLTLQSLSEQPVYSGVPTLEQESSMSHIELAKWADAILIAPASAHLISKLAHGLCDDLLTLVCICTRAPIWIVPAMNTNMWAHPVTKENTSKILQLGYEILGPTYGSQACGDIGLGRMIEPSEILKKIQSRLKRDRALAGTEYESLKNTNQSHESVIQESKAHSLFQGKKIVITAGPTYEPIDPVRYIGNNSSGRMGYSIAEEAIKRGANVTLISGPSSLKVPPVNEFKKVTTASEMLEAVMSSISKADIFISTAAVSDYTPVFVSDKKIKKTESALEIDLKPTMDIVASVTHLKEKPFVVGFAAETDNLLENAIKKLEKKNLDLIVANLIGKDQGFGDVENEIHLITPDKKVQFIPKNSKEALAGKIFDFIEPESRVFYSLNDGR